MTATTTSPLMAPGTADAPASARRDFGGQLAYVLGGFPLGLAAFVMAAVGLGLGLGAVVVVAGVPVLAGTLATARRYAALERRRAAAVTGRPFTAPHYRTAPGAGLRRMLNSLADPRSWQDLAFMMLTLCLRVVTFAVALVWSVGAVGEVLYGAWSWALPRDDNAGLLDLTFDISSRAADIGFNTAVGLALLATVVPVTRAMVALETGLVRGMVTGRRATY